MKTAIITAIVAGIIGIGVGYASAAPAEVEKPISNVEKTDSPEPTIAPTPTSVPTPEPTPRIVVETVEVVPPVCREALWAADVVIGDSATLVLEILEAYTDWPDENLEEFGVRVETIIMEYDAESTSTNWDEYVELADECHDV